MKMLREDYDEMMGMFNKYCRFVKNDDPEGPSKIVEIVSYPPTDEEKEHLENLVFIDNQV